MNIAWAGLLPAGAEAHCLSNRDSGQGQFVDPTLTFPVNPSKSNRATRFHPNPTEHDLYS
ncbi:hypothetical protein VFPPC_18033 [Pochonia chlamydosporia 170]|uniref:Uncharacterized protein n=1 Tax=Pochonia chlamydosporia 170 TaxID=1380566 RepID=A0A219APP1_METCM|nr:hypothetical protein VFPPC_18033 [Pochonia chlamydosporia 170]OWT42778.1 hypothetical protein VFPPC_18033 [Pochonia chlamydosporia 170]